MHVDVVGELPAEQQHAHGSVVDFIKWLKDDATPTSVTKAGARFGLLLAKRTSLCQVFLRKDLSE